MHTAYYDYLILGAGAAGMNAAKTLRNLKKDASIAVLSRDHYLISRPMLHFYLSHERDEHTLNFMPKDFFEKNQIDWFSDCTASSLNIQDKKINTLDGRSFGYQKLLIATGASYYIPPIAGLLEADNLYGFRDLEDAVEINQAANKAKKAVVIGAGLVGLDVAYALSGRGVKVTVIEMASHPLALQFNKEAAGYFQRRFEEAGVEFILNARVSRAVREGNKITAIETENAGSFTCDFAVIAAGARPNCAFLDGSGIETARGIVVDDYLCTNNASVFAAGDVTGLSGTWEAATKQGICAATNMAEGPSSVYSKTETIKNAMNYYGLAGISLGLAEKPDDSFQEIVWQDETNYRRLLLKDSVVRGAILIGSIVSMPTWQYAIQNQINLSGIGKDYWDITLADLKNIS